MLLSLCLSLLIYFHHFLLGCPDSLSLSYWTSVKTTVLAGSLPYFTPILLFKYFSYSSNETPGMWSWKEWDHLAYPPVSQAVPQSSATLYPVYCLTVDEVDQLRHHPAKDFEAFRGCLRFLFGGYSKSFNARPVGDYPLNNPQNTPANQIGRTVQIGKFFAGFQKSGIL